MRKALSIAAAAAGSALLVALTALVAREADRLLTERMAELKAGTLSALETMAGRKITFSSISPSIFQYLDLRDLTIYDSLDSSRSLLTIRRVRIYYGLLQLLAGRDPVSVIREIRFLNTSLSLDLDKDRDVIDLFRRLAGTSSGPGQFRARISGANMRISVTSGSAAVSLDNLFFQIEARKEAIAVDLRGSCAGRLPDGFTFVSTLRVNGSLDRNLTSSDATVRLLSFQSSLFSTGVQTLQVLWKGNTVDVRKIQDRSPVGLELLADLDKKEFTVSFQAEDFRADKLFTFSQRLAKYSNWLNAPLTASGHVTYWAAARSLEYQVDASAYLEDQLPLRQVTLDSSFRGTEKEAFFSPLRLTSPEGSMEFEGSLLFANLYPEGLLTLVNVNSGSGETVNASLSIARLNGSLDVQGARLTFGELSFEAFKLSVSPLENGASFKLSTSFAGARQDDLLQASGNVRFGQSIGKAVTEGTVGKLAAPIITLNAALSNVPPDMLYHLLMGAGELSRQQKDLYDQLGRFSVTADVAFATDFSRISVASQTVTIAQTDDPGTVIRFGLSVDSTHVKLSGFTGTWKGFKVDGGFDGTLAPGGQVSFTSNLTFLDTPYEFTGRYAPDLGFYASGSYGVEVSVVPQRGGALSYQLKGEKFPLPLRKRVLPVSFDVAGMVSPGMSWSADSASITLYNVPFLESTSNTIQLTGTLTPKRIDLSRVVFTDAYSTFTGSAGADLALPADIFAPRFYELLDAQGSAAFKTADGAESYSAHGGLAKGSISLAVQFAGSPLTRIAKSAVTGSLSGAGTVSGPLSGPVIDLTLNLKEGKLGTDALSLAGQVTVQPDVLQMHGVSVGYLSHRITGGTGLVDLKKGSFTLNGHYQGVYFSDQLQMDFGIDDGQFTPSDVGGLVSGIFDHGLKGKMSLSSIAVASTAFPAWNVGFQAAAGKLSFHGGPGNAMSGWIDSKLAFSFTLAEPLPLTGTVSGSIAADQLHAVADVQTLDLAVVNPILKSPPVPTPVGPVPIVTVTSGVATGRLVVSGPFNDPDFSGTLDVVGGGIRTAYSPDEAGPIRTTLTFDGKTIQSSKISAAAGSARLSAVISSTIDHWAPLAYDISLATEGSTPAQLRVRFGRLIANGSASGQMHISGDDRKTVVDGTILVTDGRIALGDAPGGKFVPEDVPTFVTLNAETGKRVEFYWPSENLPVLRATATPGGKLAVTYRGDTGAYTVKGNTGVQGGEIYYFDRSFIMKKGSIAFNEDQTTFDPWITATAEVREWDPSTGEEVKIYLDADSPLSKFSPRFSSDPPRTDAAILAMIGAPLFTRAESQGLGMAALLYSDILSQTWILRPFEQKVRQLLNLDMFSIRTQLLQNLVAQKLFGILVYPLDNTSVSLGKYLGNDLFLEMLVRLQQQQQLATSLINPSGGISAAGTGLQSDLELSLEWATPFFLLDWSFMPQHPESLFLTDNSLSFSWRISY